MISFVCTCKSSSITLCKKAIDDDGNVVSSIVKFIDSHQLHRLSTTLESACFECLVLKDKHVEHCQVSEQCVQGFQKHSKFFSKSIGDGNARAYYFWMLLSALFLSTFVVTVGNALLAMESKTNSWLYAPFEVLVILWSRSWGALALYLTSAFFALLFWDLFIWM